MLLLLLTTAGLVVAFAPLPIPVIAPQERSFLIDAQQFAYSPSELAVNAGDSVTIQLASTDVVHGLYIEGYDLAVAADPGQAATLTFTADTPGSFRFRCNVTCGAMHPFMIGELTVGTNDWFCDLWVWPWSRYLAFLYWQNEAESWQRLNLPAAHL